MSASSRTDVALSPEEVQTKAERGPLFRRFAWSAVLIVGIIVLATIFARWAGPAS